MAGRDNKRGKDARNALDAYAASLGIIKPKVPLWAKVLSASIITFFVAVKLAIICFLVWGGYELIIWITSK